MQTVEGKQYRQPRANSTYLHDVVLRLLLFLVQCLKHLHPHMPELALPELALPELALPELALPELALLLFLITFRQRPLLSSGNLQSRRSGVSSRLVQARLFTAHHRILLQRFLLLSHTL